MCSHLVPSGARSSISHEVPIKVGASLTSLTMIIITVDFDISMVSRPGMRAQSEPTHLSVAVITRRKVERRSKSTTLPSAT